MNALVTSSCLVLVFLSVESVVKSIGGVGARLDCCYLCCCFCCD